MAGHKEEFNPVEAAFFCFLGLGFVSIIFGTLFFVWYAYPRFPGFLRNDFVLSLVVLFGALCGTAAILGLLAAPKALDEWSREREERMRKEKYLKERAERASKSNAAKLTVVVVPERSENDVGDLEAGSGEPEPESVGSAPPVAQAAPIAADPAALKVSYKDVD